MQRAYRNPARRRAFTLIEVLVVVAMLSMLAGIVFVRFTSTAGREAQFAAQETADLLTFFAHRASTGDANIAIGYDPEAATIMLLELVGDPMNPDNLPRWEFDAYTSMVQLPSHMSVNAVRRDGRAISREDWFIPIMPGESRPNIELDLVSESTGRTYTIYLASFEIGADIIEDGEDRNFHRLPTDLDAAGRSNEIW